jgi:hypothetical protein
LNDKFTDSTLAMLLTGVGENSVTLEYPAGATLSTGKTNTTAKTGEFGTTLSDGDPIMWNSDIYSDLEAGTVRVIREAPCPPSVNVLIYDTLPGNFFQITISADTSGGCVYTSNYIVLDSENNDASVAAATDPAVPKIGVRVNNFVIAKDDQLNSARAIVVGQANALPTSGVPIYEVSQGEFGFSCAQFGGDDDNDAICNDWEDEFVGLTISAGSQTFTYGCERLVHYPDATGATATILNNDSTNPVTCPRDDVKDIFYEVNWMRGHEPNVSALLNVVDSFRNAPEPINLHFLLDENIGFHQTEIPFENVGTEVGLLTLKESWYGTANERTGNTDDVKELLGAKRQVFRHMWVVHDLSSNPGSSGYAELGGNDIVVSLGSFAGNIGSQTQWEGTVMHEIGHNINLNHGGYLSKQNCKPNHPSVMNYLFQFNYYYDNRPLDFSRVALNDINERDLNEQAGISGYTHPVTGDFITVYGPFQANIKTKTLSNPINPIDWNRNNKIDVYNPSSPILGNINNFGFSGCTNDDGTPGLGLLTGSNDWSSIDLNMRDSAAFADGIKALNPITSENEEPDPTDDQSAIEQPEEIVGVGQPPTAIVGVNGLTIGPFEFNEGQKVTLSDESTDPENEDIQFVNWDVDNDGTFHTIGIDATGPTAEVFFDDDDDLTSPDDGQGVFTIGMRIWDSGDNDDSTTVDIIVNNLAPTVDAGADVLGTVGVPVNVSPTFEDAGMNDTHTATIDWGDGTGTMDCQVNETQGTEFGDVSNGTAICSPHLYDGTGPFTVTVTVRDDDGGVETDTLQVELINFEFLSPTPNTQYNNDRNLPVQVAILTNDGDLIRDATLTVFIDDTDTPATSSKGSGNEMQVKGQKYVFDLNPEGLVGLHDIMVVINGNLDSAQSITVEFTGTN